MNKLLLTSICAAALTASASAFTLDLSSLNGQTLGAGSITNSFGTFTVVGPGTAFVTGGVATINNLESFTVIYPSTVTYVGTLVGSNINVNVASNQIQYTSTGDGATAQSITFNPTAVPEPSSTALLGLGGLALILRRRK